ncbi:serine/threonine protein kinase [Nostoc commune]|uniref:serine/threonine protein kinase n=1 Tax=Nostoc commune TaxID=1178 RepID=UPI0018C84C71|nr:serine/threonine-protein kinase [Nostoc commune]MBG1263739.1 serine/threonine protein kinase [Nostoc commune BAE]
MSIDLIWLQQQFPEISSLNYLNKGGQKRVISGSHATEGDVVLKICSPMAGLERIIREIQAVQEISSLRVPKIFDFGLNNNSPIGNFMWIREQRIPGRSLRDVLEKQGCLDLSQILRLGLQILEVLADAEKSRIVHRDVKPENIIIDIDGDAWLLDFGLSRHLDLDSLTDTAGYFGVYTLGYAPPEQYRNIKREIDSRSDLFALGVTLYECAEGVNFFRHEARDPNEIFRRVETKLLPRISKVMDKKGQLPDLLEAMTRPRPSQRLNSVAEALIWMKEIYTEEGIN